MDHVGIEVTGVDGREGFRRQPGRTEAAGVGVRRQVANQHAGARGTAAAERQGGRLENRGLAGSGRSHQIDRRHVVVPEVFPVVPRRPVVGGQEALVRVVGHHVRIAAAA